MKLNSELQKLIFTEARSHHAWKPDAVTDAQLHELYELGKWGPTSANTQPARLIFVRGEAAQAKLLACLMPGNVDQIKAAPVTVIVAQDLEFYEQLPKQMAAIPNAREWFAGNEAVIQSTAFRNSSLTGAYMMVAARALGLDVCPMSGFDNAKVDEAFLAGTKWKSNFIFALGHGDTPKLYPRGPRLTFEEACRIV